jgi:hypothetical protein
MRNVLTPTTKDTQITHRNVSTLHLFTIRETIMSKSPQMDFHFSWGIDSPESFPVFFPRSSNQNAYPSQPSYG